MPRETVAGLRARIDLQFRDYQTERKAFMAEAAALQSRVEELLAENTRISDERDAAVQRRDATDEWRRKEQSGRLEAEEQRDQARQHVEAMRYDLDRRLNDLRFEQAMRREAEARCRRLGAGLEKLVETLGASAVIEAGRGVYQAANETPWAGGYGVETSVRG